MSLIPECLRFCIWICICDLVRAQGPSQKQSSPIYEDQAAFLKSLTLHKESCEGKFWEEQESSLQPPGQVQDYPCPARSRHSCPTAAWPHRLVQHCLSRASTAQCAFPSGCFFLPFRGLVSLLSAFLSTSGFLFAHGFCLLQPLSFCFCPDAAHLCFKALQRRDFMSSVGLCPV